MDRSYPRVAGGGEGGGGGRGSWQNTDPPYTLHSHLRVVGEIERSRWDWGGLLQKILPWKRVRVAEDVFKSDETNFSASSILQGRIITSDGWA